MEVLTGGVTQGRLVILRKRLLSTEHGSPMSAKAQTPNKT